MRITGAKTLDFAGTSYMELDMCLGIRNDPWCNSNIINKENQSPYI